MQIGALSPVTRILAAMAIKPEPFGARDEQTGATASPQQPATQPGQPLGSVQMLVTLAGFDPERERRRQMAEKSQAGLDELEALHVELLLGEPTPERLDRLVEWIGQIERPDDPLLAGIMAELELRARVELAKLDIEI